MPLQNGTTLTDFAAERIVIAGLMRAPDLNARRMKGLLRTDDFAWVHHAWIFEKCLEMWKSRKEVPLSLPRLYHAILSLRGPCIFRADFGRNVGGMLADIYESDPTGAWCVGKAQVVRSLAERRRIVHAARVRIRDAIYGTVKV